MVQFVGSGLFKAITGAAKAVENNKSDYLVIITLRGAANILSGSTQYLLGQAFKLSKDRQYNTVQSAAHIERGARVFRQGVEEFLPGAVGGYIGFSLASWAWHRLK